MKESAPHIIVHYHLRPGGVTRVIETTSKALTKAGIPHLILCGAPTHHDSDLPLHVIPDLDYSEEDRSDLAPQLRNAAQDHFGTQQCIWHFHNPCLAKNPSLTRAMVTMANRGLPIILQHHDFAEDGRSAYHHRLKDFPLLYPVAPRVVHACINSRDRNALIAAGLPASQSRVMPNPITIENVVRRAEPDWVFLPARGIRRKNLGEVLLLACHAPAGTRIAISRRPDQSNWQVIHDHWQQLAKELQLPIEFGVTDRLAPSDDADATFTSWLAHSSHLLTTSVSEGFGLTFLEGAALRIPVIGRRLPELDPDLSDLPLGHLYTRLLVPTDDLDMASLHRAREESLAQTHRNYGRPYSKPQTNMECESIDFARLPESIQESVIRRHATQPSGILAETADETIPLDEYLTAVLSDSSAQQADLGQFQPDRWVTDLIQTRSGLLKAPEHQPTDLNRAALVDQFLKPSRFNFLCE